MRPQTASVVVEECATVYRLSVEDLKKMEAEAPDTAAAFHKYILRLLGERLAFANQAIRALME